MKRLDNFSKEEIVKDITKLKFEPFQEDNLKILYNYAESKDYIVKSEALVALSKIYIDKGDYANALELLYKVEADFITGVFTDKKIMAKAYGYIGNLFFRLADGPKSSKYFFKVLKIFEDLKDEVGKAKAYLSLSNSFGVSSETEKSLKFFKLAESILIQEDNCEEFLIVSYTNILSQYYKNKDLDNVKIVSYKSYELSKSIHNKRWKGIAFLNVASYELEINNLVLAKEFIDKAFPLLMEANDPPSKISLCIQVLRYEIAKGEIIKGKELGLKAINLAKENKLNARLMFLFELVSKVYELLGDNKSALYYYKLYSKEQFRLSVENQETMLKEVEYKTKLNKLSEANEVNLLHLEKVKSINKDLEQFAYMTSHDLKAPLRSIVVRSEFIQTKDVPKEELTEQLNAIKDSSIKMSTLIDSLLEYSKLGFTNLPMRSTPLKFAIDQSIIILNDFIISKKAAVQMPDQLPTVYGNLTALSQLFQNLIGNSIKYNKNQTPKIVIDFKEDESSIYLSLKDNGIGIPQEKIAFIFQAFNRAHSHLNYEGSGIGLAICKKIVDAHNGSIQVYSDGSFGSTFTCQFPKEKI